MEDESRRVKVASVFSSMHTSVVVASAKMLVELKRYNYVTPTNFLELVKVKSQRNTNTPPRGLWDHPTKGEGKRLRVAAMALPSLLCVWLEFGATASDANRCLTVPFLCPKIILCMT